MRRLCVCMVVFMALLLFIGGERAWSYPTGTVLITKTWSGNGHKYKIVAGDFEWDKAKSAAESCSGWYLATITSAEEQDFIVNDLLSGLSSCCCCSRAGLWLGGEELHSAWTWVTGEPWSYEHWGTDQPSTGSYLAISAKEGCGGGCCGHGCCRSLHLGDWYTSCESGCSSGCGCSCCRVSGYIAESSVPEPATLFLIGAGLLGILGYKFKDCSRYQD